MIQGDGATTVRGSGTITNPYIIESQLALQVVDSATVNLSLVGDGSVGNPYRLSANATIALNGISDVNATGGSTGYVLAQQSNGSFALVPPATASAGSVAVGNGLTGDGSSGSPVRIQLAPNSGLTLSGSGLAVASARNWSTYTPVVNSSITGTITLDSGSEVRGRYIQDGSTVHVNIWASLSGNFTMPSGALRLSLPVQDADLGSMRQVLTASGLFTDDGSDPNTSWQNQRIGIVDLEGTGYCNRIRFDRGGFAYHIGNSYPRWRSHRIQFWISGAYEAE